MCHADDSISAEPPTVRFRSRAQHVGGLRERLPGTWIEHQARSGNRSRRAQDHGNRRARRAHAYDNVLARHRGIQGRQIGRLSIGGLGGLHFSRVNKP